MSEDQEDTASAPGASKPPHDLGILLVHGIGEQKQGETLNEFGAPIIKWIDQWLGADLKVNRLVANLAQHIPTKDFDGVAAFTTGTLRPPVLPQDTPAHAEAVIVRRKNHVEIGRQTWLFAESWWSPQTLAPRVSPFLLWLITRGPWILLMHLSQAFCLDYRAMLQEMQRPEPITRRLRPSLALYGQLLRFTLATVLWLAISLALIALWCVVSLVALVPIGYVRKRVYELLLAITGVVGDSYVLINDPIQNVAFANTARQALLWLKKQGCKKIAVVAHSQGAAVARNMLLAPNAPKVDLLVTVGPGIAKLDALAEQERMAPEEFIWCGAAAPLTLLTALSFVRLWMGGHTGFALWGFPILVGVLSLIAIFRSWHSTATRLDWLRPNAFQKLKMRHYQPGMRWMDFYASHDPVSNGSLSATIAAGLRRIVSRRVRVLASWLDDHTHYWVSRADFVPRVAQALDRCARAGLFATASGVNRLRAARGKYGWCVRLLSVLRWCDALALAVAGFQFGRVRAVARDLFAWLAELPVASIAQAADGLRGAFGWIGSAIAGRPVDGTDAAALLLLAALALATLHVWRRIVAYWWDHMAAHCLTPVFRPSAAKLALAKQGLLAALVVALGILPLALSLGWSLAPGLITWKTLDEFLAVFATLTVLLLYAGLLSLIFLMTREVAQNVMNAYRQHRSLLQAVKAQQDLWIVPAAWIFYGAGGGVLLTQNRYTPMLLPVVAGLAALTVAGLWAARLRTRLRARRLAASPGKVR